MACGWRLGEKLVEMTDVKFIDTSGWQILQGLNTGGTRAKRLLQDDNGDRWYFKCSERKPGAPGHPEKYYKYEFWSEVIAYQVGKLFGLDILRYDVAYNDGDVGCISPEMDAGVDEQLVEVGRYMTTHNPAFAPDDTTSRKEYTFQLLEETVQYFELEEYWPSFFTTLVFDAIIGNTDRHQENWAFIGSTYTDAPMKLRPSQEQALRNLLSTNDEKTFIRRLEEYQLRVKHLKRMAPIYDSGSSLARELTEERIKQLLNDHQHLTGYINRGSSELHWDRRKESHFKLLEKILETRHADALKNAAFFLQNWDGEQIEHLVYHIDESVPAEHMAFKMPLERKNLIVKLLTLRHRRVVDIIYG